MRASNPAEEKVIELVEPVAAGLGYRLVRVRVSGLKRKRLQIMAEREDGFFALEDCEALSHALYPVFEETDPITGEYDLEISSPGIDRPLVRLEDFERFAGHEAKLETLAMLDGRRRFKGVLAGVADGNVKIAIDDEEFSIPFTQLSEARLLLTEKLIQEDLKRSKLAAAQIEKEETP